MENSSRLAENSAGDDSGEPSSSSSLRAELANVSFQELQRMKAKLGTKIFNTILHGKQPITSLLGRRAEITDKHKPREISSKIRPRPLKNTRKKLLRRDPRFDDLSGEFDERQFHKRYNFLSDLRKTEMKTLKTEMSEITDEWEKKKTRSIVDRMDQADKAESKRKEELEFLYDWKAKQFERIKEGKKPYFPNPVQMKKKQLVDKFESLKKSGKLEKYLVKKRERNLVRDRKKLQSMKTDSDLK